MLVIAWNSTEVIEDEPCEPEPRYSPILEKMVEAGMLEVRHVDAGGRMRKQALDPSGDPLWIPVETEPTDLRYLLPGAGRYAVVARDHQGRHLARNDVFARESGQPDPWRQTTAYERLKDELERERERRRAAEAQAQAAREQKLRAEAAVDQLLGQHERLKRELGDALRLAEQRRVEAEATRRRRREAEEALAVAKKKAREQKKVQPVITQKDIARFVMTAIPIGYYVFRRIKNLESKLNASRPTADVAHGDAAKRPARPANARPSPSNAPDQDGGERPIAPET